MSKAAKQWAEKVFARRPVAVSFTRIPIDCIRTRCTGYHETFLVTVDEDGNVWSQLTAGFHSLVANSQPLYAGRGVEALARLGFQYMKWARQINPWAQYPRMGYRSAPDGHMEEVWFE